MSKLKQLLPLLPEGLRDYYLKYNNNKQLMIWESKGSTLPIPHVVKQLAIKRCQEKHNVDTLIETGTYLGDMVYAQRKIFKKIYTIELSEALCKLCQKRLKKYKHIEVIQGDSGTILNTIVKQLGGKSIFWLDGHYSGGCTAKGDTYSPIIQELNFILSSDYEHIILIDDAREFKGNNDYPTIKELEKVIKKSKYANSTIEIQDDIIRIELKKNIEFEKIFLVKETLSNITNYPNSIHENEEK